MRYKTLLVEGEPRDLGTEDLKVFENPDGSASITFSDSYIQRMGWQVGDYITWEIKDDGSMSIRNQQAELRSKTRQL